MADLVITTSQIVPTSNRGLITHGKCGEAITAGQTVYKKASDGLIYKAIDSSAAAADCLGIAVASTLAANQEIPYQKGGTIVLGAAASIAAGTVYVVSDTAGGIAPEADLGASDFVTYVGIGDASNGIVMPTTGPHASGVQHA